MEAQAYTDPIPPVIIKIGGGSGPPDPLEFPIEFGSGLIDWIDAPGSPTLQARTTFSGQIHDLTVEDPCEADPIVCKVHPLEDALTTLTLYFEGADTFAVSEVRGEDGSIYLEAKSNGKFEPNYRKPDGCWTMSTASFASAPVKVEFRQRKNGANVDFMKLEYRFNSADVELRVRYRKP